MRSFKSYLGLLLFLLIGSYIGIVYIRTVLIITYLLSGFYLLSIYFHVKAEIKEYEMYQYKFDRLVQYLIATNHEIPREITLYKSNYLNEDYIVTIKYLDDAKEEVYGQISVNLPPYFDVTDRLSAKAILLSNNDVYDLPRGFEVVAIKHNK